MAPVTAAIWAGILTGGAAAILGDAPFGNDEGPRRGEGGFTRRLPAARADEPADARVRLDYPDAEIWIRVTSNMERRFRARNCEKEPWTVQWLEEHVHPREVVYDIGANVGTFTLIAAIARGAFVVAFEPGYANFARLCENISLNECSDRVVPVPLPLADTNGLIWFVYRTVEPGESRHRIKRWKLGRRPKGGQAEQAMCGIRLDDARAQFTLPPPAHIKLDVDGAELRVLRGAVDTLRLGRLRTLLIEVDPALWTEVHSLVTGLGFDSKRESTDLPHMNTAVDMQIE